MSEEALIDFTPELKAEALEIFSGYDHGPLFTPPSQRGAFMLPGTSGGAHWAGGAAHPDNGVLFIPSNNRNRQVQLVPNHGEGEPFAYGAEIGEVYGPRGLPLTKPPYGRLTAIDLNTGEHLWTRALGKGLVRHPALRDLHLPDMGEARYQFAIATPTLVLAGPVGGGWKDGFYTDRIPSMLALDPTTGRQVGSVPLPRRYVAPITYETGGRQYIVVPMGWGPGAELVAMAIPRPGEELPLQLVEHNDADHDHFYDAVGAFDAGDAALLAQLLSDDNGLLTARGYLHEEYEPEHFRGATLLHHVAGDPVRSELPDNVLELARVLLQTGADPNAETEDGTAVLDLVIRADQPRWLKLKTELIELLIDQGADPDRAGGRTLHAALTDRDSGEIAKLLYEKGAKIDLRFAAALNLMSEVEGFFTADGGLRADALSRYHPSPTAAEMSDSQILDEALSYAAFWGNVEVAELLLDRGAAIDALPPSVHWEQDRGRSALHMAVDGRRTEMVRYLLKRRANPSIREKNRDRTPLRWARWDGNEEILDMLRQATAAFTLPSHVIPRTAGPIVIDGVLDEPSWAAATTVGDFVFPWWKEGEKEQTEARLLWDDTNLYVSFVAQDKHISAVYENRDDPVSKGDCVEVFVAPDTSNMAHYYNIEANVIGTVLDRFQLAEPTGSYTAEITVATRIDGSLNDESDEDRSFTTEFAIPFSSFADTAPHIPPEPGDVWRLNLYRIGGKVNFQYSMWSDTWNVKPKYHAPNRFGVVHFSDAVVGAESTDVAK